MSEPLDLRALADVEEPEIVREALRRFRRRVVTRYLWVGFTAALIGVGVWWAGTPGNLADEINAADHVAYPGEVVMVGDFVVGLDRVADLGEDLGLRFVVLSPDDAPQGLTLIVQDPFDSQSMERGNYELYTKIPKPADGLIELSAQPMRCEPVCDEGPRVSIDLADLQVPRSIWERG